MTAHDPFAAVQPRPGVPPAPGPDWFRAVTVAGDIAYLSGQVPFDSSGNLVTTGRLGAEVDIDAGYRCARQCAVNLLDALHREFGGLTVVRQLLKVTVFVASTPEFRDQPLVAHGASELLVEVLGERGHHARSAIGVAALPRGCPVEVEMIAALDTDVNSSPSSH